MAAFTKKQITELEAPLNSGAVKTRAQSGQTLSYIEGWHAIAEANRIFGHDGWIRETVEMRECRCDEVDNKWRVGFIAKVRITVGDPKTAETIVYREGYGYGSGIARDKGDAFEGAVKEAETDAMKRALMTFGNPFGLALYDKAQANVLKEGETPPQEAQEQIAHFKKSLQEATSFQEVDSRVAALRDLAKMWTRSFRAATGDEIAAAVAQRKSEIEKEQALDAG